MSTKPVQNKTPEGIAAWHVFNPAGAIPYGWHYRPEFSTCHLATELG